MTKFGQWHHRCPALVKPDVWLPDAVEKCRYCGLVQTKICSTLKEDTTPETTNMLSKHEQTTVDFINNPNKTAAMDAVGEREDVMSWAARGPVDTSAASDFLSQPSEILQVLADRGKRYGHFSGHADITFALKEVMEATGKWGNLANFQKEALHMIAHKLGRILNGDPSYDDSWVDLAGYAELVVRILRGENS